MPTAPNLGQRRYPNLLRAFQDKPFTEVERFADNVKKRREGTDKDLPFDVTDAAMMGEVTAPMVGMTRYAINKVPMVAERMNATKEFLKATAGLGPETKAAGELFAQRYPRVAAHMDISNIKPDLSKQRPGLRGLTYWDRLKGNKTPVELLPESGMVENTLLHEGTHVAQNLLNKKTPEIYARAHEALKNLGFRDEIAYRLIPHEISASNTASRKLGENIGPTATKALLEHIVKKIPAGDPNRIALAALLR